MKRILLCILVALLLGATAWTSSVLGYRRGLAAQPPVVADSSDQSTWQYQSYHFGKNQVVSDVKLSMIVNAYGAQQFEPCAAPANASFGGTDLTHLMWFRRRTNPFTPSLHLPVYSDQLASSN